MARLLGRRLARAPRDGEDASAPAPTYAPPSSAAASAAAAADWQQQQQPCVRLGPLLALSPPELEQSFWRGWRPALVTADLIFAVAPLLTISSDAGRVAAGACPWHAPRTVAVPLLLLLARAALGEAGYWRLRPPLLLPLCAYLASAGSNCYVRGLAAAADANARRLAPGPCALAAAATGDWPPGLSYALMQTVPSTGSVVYALLLPVSFRARLVLQAIEVLAAVPAALPLAVRVVSAYLLPAPGEAAAGAAAAGGVGGGGGACQLSLQQQQQQFSPKCFITRALLASRCPALVLAVCYGVIVGFIFPLAIVYWGEAAAKEAHLQALALRQVAAVAHQQQQQQQQQQQGREGRWEGPSPPPQGRLPAAAVLLASAAARPPPEVLRAMRFGGVVVVAAAAAALTWRVSDAAVHVAAQAAPGWLEARGLCPGLLPPAPSPPPAAPLPPPMLPLS